VISCIRTRKRLRTFSGIASLTGQVFSKGLRKKRRSPEQHFMLPHDLRRHPIEDGLFIPQRNRIEEERERGQPNSRSDEPISWARRSPLNIY
jgi:hypothetical protein